jgi:hypothetical protein
VTLAELRAALKASGGHRAIAAKALGVSKAWVQELVCLYRRKGHVFVGDRKGDFRNRAEYEPTEAEIQAKCLEIQAGWSRRERMMRMPSRPPPWMPPVVEFDDDSRDVEW